MHDWGTLSRAERDAAYNNSAAVPDSQAHSDERIAASARFRGETRGILDLPYGEGERQEWDLFPAADPAAPCFVFIHGGYWQRGRREDNCVLGAGLCAHGWSLALPGYTLAPDATLTEIVAQLGRALDWLGSHGPAHGIAGPLLLSGWSAGGHLTAMLLGHPRVTAALAISGVYELGPIRDTYLNEALRLTDAEIAALSPLRLPPVPKPMAVAYGTRELHALCRDSRDLNAMRAEAHIGGALLPIAGTDHFTILDDLRRPDGQLVHAAIDLLRQ